MSNDSQTSSRLAVAAGVAVATICYWGLWKTKSGTAKARRETQQRLDAERAQQEVHSDLSGEIEFGAQQCVDSDGEEDLTLDMLMAESDVTDVSEDAETSAQSKGSSSTGAKSPTAHSPTTTTATLGSGTPWSHHVLLNKNSSEYEKWVTTKCRVGERALVRRSKQTGSRATIRFVGTLSVKPGIWVGVELDPEAGPGKNSGQINNEKIFSCARGQGIFCLEDAIEGIDAPLDTLSAAGILAGHWVGERVCGPPKTPTKDVSEQPCSYWFVFEGEGNGYSSNGCSLFLDGRRSSRSEWSIQLREHQFLQRLVLTCQPCGAAPSDATMYALAFLDSNTVELRFAPSHQEFEDGENMTILVLRRVAAAHPRGGFSVREQVLLCIDELSRFWVKEAEVLAGNIVPADANKMSQRKDILLETGRIYFRHGLEPLTDQYLQQIGLQDDAPLLSLREQMDQDWLVLNNLLA